MGARYATTFGCLVALCCFGCTDGDGPRRPTRAPDPVFEHLDFTEDVLPILSEHCYECHAGDRSDGGLRLDTRAHATAIRAGARRGIVPSDPEGSLVITTVESTDPVVRMPPDAPLPERYVEILRLWIAQGAPYPEHWSLEVPTRPLVPSATGSPIDAFVDETLSVVGLEAGPRADRTTLIRRATLTLTGLPPTLEEVDAFLAAPDEDAAYAALVERLLSSPRHAEHMARDWLDQAGYGDSNGMYADEERFVWAWREWVIAAFADDMRFDEFVTLQLAGDLGPAPEPSDVLATAFLRMHRTTEEGGVHLEEYRALYASERAIGVAQTLFGMTMQCARCHEHRYDPISMEDFYALTDCFHHVGDEGFTAVARPAIPELAAMGPLQEVELDAVRRELAAARSALAAVDLDAPLATWETTAGPARFGPAPVRVIGTELGTSLALDSPGHLVATGEAPRVEAWTLALDATAPVTALQLSGFSSRVGGGVALSELSLRLEAPGHRRTIPIDTVVFTSGPDASALVDGSNSTFLYVDETVTLLVVPSLPVVVGPGEELRLRIEMRAGNGSTAATMLVESSGDPAAVLPPSLAATLATPRGSRTAAAQAALAAHVARVAGTGDAREAATAVQTLERRAAELSFVPRTRVMDTATPEHDHETHIALRGQYYVPGEVVHCAVPAAIGGDDRAMADRAALAEWVVGERNPLTARVLVNRLFQVVFGRGLVATTHDFGRRGELPSHPALLDWLAVELVESGWDARHVLRLLVTSEAFRRSSVEDGAAAAIDPQNRFFWRGPRRRLDAEVIRDQALFVAGLLVERLGGPSVRPYQPPGLYESLIDHIDSPMRVYRPDTSTDRLHRRSLYTFWRRGMLVPSLALFDAPDRVNPVPSRDTTITPTQMLALLDEPLFVEAARHLAERVRREAVGIDAQLALAFRLATSRPPTPAELDELRALHAEELAAPTLGVLSIGESDRDSAGDPAGHAAMTAVARAVLNLSETITGE